VFACTACTACTVASRAKSRRVRRMGLPPLAEPAPQRLYPGDRVLALAGNRHVVAVHMLGAFCSGYYACKGRSGTRGWPARGRHLWLIGRHDRAALRPTSARRGKPGGADHAASGDLQAKLTSEHAQQASPAISRDGAPTTCTPPDITQSCRQGPAIRPTNLPPRTVVPTIGNEG
jgi:hypothetical protein